MGGEQVTGSEIRESANMPEEKPKRPRSVLIYVILQGKGNVTTFTGETLNAQRNFMAAQKPTAFSTVIFPKITESLERPLGSMSMLRTRMNILYVAPVTDKSSFRTSFLTLKMFLIL